MSFAQRFAAGQQIAKGLVDTYQTGVRNRELKAVDDWKPSEEFDGYTPQDAQQMHAIANARDADGNPYYQMQDDGQGGLAVRSNFSYAGADGAPVAPGSTVGLAPRRVTEFGGQRFDAAELTPERMQALQDRERIRIMGRTDPELGMRMRRQAAQDDRDTQRFGWEQQAAPLKQQAAELQVAGAQRTERTGVRADGVRAIEDAAMALPDAEVRTALTSYLNTNQSDLPLVVMGQSKDGLMMAERNPQSGAFGTPFAVPLATGRKLVVGQQLAAAGKGAEALAYLAGVDANITAIIDKYNKQTMDVAGFNNSAAVDGSRMRNDEARTSIARAGLALRGQAGGGRGEKPEDLDKLTKVTPGEMFRDGRGTTWVVAEDGSQVMYGGLQAPEFASWLEEHDFPPVSDEIVTRLPGGFIQVPGAGTQVYNPSDPRDVAAAKAAVERVTQVMERNNTAGKYRPGSEPAPRQLGVEAQRQAAQIEAARYAAREAARNPQVGLRPMTQ